MARALRDRYADMTDVLADLERIKEGKAPVGPHGLVRGGLRQVRRVSPVAWGAVGAVTLAVVGWLLLHPGTAPKPNMPLRVAPTTNPPVALVNTTRVVNPSNWPRRRHSCNLVWQSILAGQSGVGGSQDGRGTNAQFLAPGGMEVDGAGNVYVADSGNNTIRKIALDGNVTTFAGLAGHHGSLDGQGGAARFFAPFGIAVDKDGNVYVSEVGNCTIRKITPGGQVSTLAGLAGNPGNNDGVGDNAQFRNPFGLAVDANGTVYVADTSNFTIRKIATNGVVSTLAGLAGNPGYIDGTGTNALFWEPRGLVLSPSGTVLCQRQRQQRKFAKSPQAE